MQGDLHNPKQVNVPLFHERKALSYNEQTNIPKTMVKPYAGDIPSYKESLQNAFTKLVHELEEDESDWAKKSLQCLSQLKIDYKFAE